MNRILNFKGDYKGLDENEAAEKLELYGPNSEIKLEEKRKFKFYGVFKSPRVYLMLIAAAMYYAADIPDNRLILKGVLLLLLVLIFCVFNIMLENYCDKKTKEMSSAAEVIVRVVRGGRILAVKREEIVQDDLIILQGGENVPADAHVLEANDVTADESIFENESDGSLLPVKPVEKRPDSDGKNELKQSCVYKGTKILSGILIARVFATGQDVKIRPELRTARELHRTNTETAVNRLSGLLTCVAGILLVITAVANLIAAGRDVPDNASALSFFAETVLPAVSVALCALPVSIGLIVRVYYVCGAEKLSADYGEVKSLRTVEALNSVTVACIDIDSVTVSDNTPIIEEISKNEVMLSRIAAMSCRTDGSATEDSYEKAILISATEKNIDLKELYGNTLIQNYTPEQDADYNKINGNLWEVNGTRLLCVKGAPEVVLSFCRLAPEQLFPIQQKQSEYTKQGHRVIAVAFSNLEDFYKEDEENENLSDLSEEDELEREIPDALFDVEYTFLGLIVFSATVRENIPRAVQSCYNAGVKLVMISPDAKRSGGIETALAVAYKAGIKEEGVTAGNKEDVVEALKADGEVVAVFGTDSSDIPALETADVGIALEKHTTGDEWDYGIDTMSEFTTGSAYEACDLILNDKSGGVGGTGEPESNSLLKAAGAFREAKQIQRNIRRAITVAVAAFTSTLLFSVLNLFIGKDFILEAVFISTLSAITIPLLTLFFLNNKHEKNNGVSSEILEPDGKISGSLIMAAAFQGLSLFAALFVMFLIFRRIEGYTAGMLRSIFLIMFTSGGITAAWANASRTNPFYVTFRKSLKNMKSQTEKIPLVFTAVLLLTLPLFIYMPYVNSAFGLDALKNPWIFVLSLAVGAASTGWFDFINKKTGS